MTVTLQLNKVDEFFKNVLKTVCWTFAIGLTGVFLTVLGYRIVTILWTLR
jgi:hypothetical protein